MRLIECEGYNIIIFSDGESITEEVKASGDTPIIFVALDGTDTNTIPQERSLVKNLEQSFRNHMMWEGLLDDEEQLDYTTSCAERFFHTGKQMVIEEYDFQDDEPFYDYSK